MKKILIVEDVELNLELLIQLLEDGYELVTAADGEEGIRVAETELPDLILMDMSLPILDGWQATERIKSSPILEHIIVIGLSAHAMSGDRDKARSDGCDDYLTKPLDEDLVFEKLAQHLG